MMQIEGPKRTGATGKTDKAKKAGSSSSSSFSEMLVETNEEVSAPAAAVSVAGVNLFAALQAAEHATDQEQRRQAIDHADDLLNDLEDLRIGLLLGSYTLNQLRNLASRLTQKRISIHDPQLLSLLDDIQLRAAVELAKYE
jgi:hypothetical protein